MSTRYSIAEQVLLQLKAGYPKQASAIKLDEIMVYCGQVINTLLKQDHITVNLPSGETIPNGVFLTAYDGLVPVPFKGVSKITLPATPVSLPRNMGVYLVCRSIPTGMVTLGTPILGATVISATEIDLYWGSVPHGTNYILERALDAAFTSSLTTIYNGAAILYNNTGLTTATHYYYRLTATAVGYITSGYGLANATTN